jgi:hypothetical protein
MGKKRKAYKVLVGKPAVMKHYEDLDADGFKFYIFYVYIALYKFLSGYTCFQISNHHRISCHRSAFRAQLHPNSSDRWLRKRYLGFDSRQGIWKYFFRGLSTFKYYG